MKKAIIFFVTGAVFWACQNQDGRLALTPADKLGQSWWKERHEKVLAELKRDPQLILIGNSILHTLDEADREKVWSEYLDKYRAVNMGFSGDRTENVIWRLQNGELEGIQPRVALLLIGTNNTDGNHYLHITPPEELSAAIWKICRIIREKLPHTEILLMGILPYGYKPNYRDNINKMTNRIIRDFPQRNPHIHYMDIGHIYLDESGKVRKDLMPDFLHPNAEGHMLMFEALMPEISKLMIRKE